MKSRRGLQEENAQGAENSGGRAGGAGERRIFAKKKPGRWGMNRRPGGGAGAS